MQLTHSKHTPTPTNKEIILLCDHVTSPANQGALFRLADAFGVKEIIFCGATVDVSSSRLKRMARNTVSHVSFRESENLIKEVEQLQTAGYTAVALEITSESIPIVQLVSSGIKKAVLIIGAESAGISEQVLQLSQHIVHIPMLGQNSSMNVAQAAAIALYELSK